MRVGIGYDSHRFAGKKGRQLILGGVLIPNPKGLEGHSDADAVAHALTDAILGAAGLGDIGRLFPASDPRWKNADSIGLLNQAYLKTLEAGHEFVQADITVICEQPKLAPHIEAMQERLPLRESQDQRGDGVDRTRGGRCGDRRGAIAAVTGREGSSDKGCGERGMQ